MGNTTSNRNSSSDQNSVNPPDANFMDCCMPCQPQGNRSIVTKQADPPIKPPRKSTSENEPLLVAARHNNMHDLPRLIEENPHSASMVKDSAGNLAIHLAAAGGHIAALDCLFQVLPTTYSSSNLIFIFFFVIKKHS
jgi:ankyrin repeat protein